jgi:hypothetical protein
LCDIAALFDAIMSDYPTSDFIPLVNDVAFGNPFDWDMDLFDDVDRASVAPSVGSYVDDGRKLHFRKSNIV